MNMRSVIVFVGCTLLVSVLGIVALALTHNPIPDILQVVTGSSLTGLVGLLANPNKELTGRGTSNDR